MDDEQLPEQLLFPGGSSGKDIDNLLDHSLFTHHDDFDVHDFNASLSGLPAVPGLQGATLQWQRGFSRFLLLCSSRTDSKDKPSSFNLTDFLDFGDADGTDHSVPSPEMPNRPRFSPLQSV